jgi:hypothetical protein
MNSAHLPFSQPIHASRQIQTLLHLRKTATWVARECFLESAEQTGLRRRSTVRQQQRSSCQRFFLQMHQYLLNDHRIFYAGNDPGWSSTDSAPLNINLENPLQPLRPGHGRMTLNGHLLLLAIRCFGLVTFSPLCRRHQRTVFAVRGTNSRRFRRTHRESASD